MSELILKALIGNTIGFELNLRITIHIFIEGNNGLIAMHL